MDSKISDYALIGNCRAAALVNHQGSIDWCCLPEFDSPSIFAALLDPELGGHFSISPISVTDSTHSYLSDTNVVETKFVTRQGSARLLDAFTVLPEKEKLHSLFPDHEILRVVEGCSGRVRMRMELAPRTFFGKDLPCLRNLQKLGIQFTWKGNSCCFLSTLDPEMLEVKVDQAKVVAEFSVQEGEKVLFSFSYSSRSPAILPELKQNGFKRLLQTISYWKDWLSTCRYTGRYAPQVKRSALTLKLLNHAPSGAIIAAPTTSLPEVPGGGRNWDYRYCWLRDASFTIRTLMRLNFTEEAHAYMNWILHATQLTRPELQIVYSVFGHSSLKEENLQWLRGYNNSTPVRVGNRADSQFQLDIYGEVLDAVYTYAPLMEGTFDKSTRSFLLGLGSVICKRWKEPDNGIWEVRSSCLQHTHSKVMAWVGLDRLIKLSEKNGWKEAPLEEFYRVRRCLQNLIEESGFSQEVQAYTRELHGETLDASLLVLPLVGYCKATSPRMLSTTKAICGKLLKNDLVYRYLNVDDGVSGREGAFVICSFWLAENLAKTGEVERAEQVFEAMLKRASPTGLLSEEIDPDTLDLLGNYPQGFSHIGLINAALAIQEAQEQKSVVV